MQAVFLITAKGFTEKQIGILLLTFGLSQFVCMAPAGYFMDYSNHKIQWVMAGTVLTAITTVLTTVTSDPNHMVWMIALKVIHVIKGLLLATEVIDSVGAGILGTLQILVTSDISGGTGRFSLCLGVTTASMCLGATISAYLGQAIAADYEYEVAFAALGAISLIPVLLYGFCMPETLPEYAKPQPRRQRVRELLRRLDEKRKQLLERSTPRIFATTTTRRRRRQQQQVGNSKLLSDDSNNLSSPLQDKESNYATSASRQENTSPNHASTSLLSVELV